MRAATVCAADVFTSEFEAKAFSRSPSATRQSLLKRIPLVETGALLLRLTALRPCLAAGLPLSCAISLLRKIGGHWQSTEADHNSNLIKRYLLLFVNHF
jgi:hypothetical protein